LSILWFSSRSKFRSLGSHYRSGGSNNARDSDEAVLSAAGGWMGGWMDGRMVQPHACLDVTRFDPRF
jgi:hypothetical protein